MLCLSLSALCLSLFRSPLGDHSSLHSLFMICSRSLPNPSCTVEVNEILKNAMAKNLANVSYSKERATCLLAGVVAREGVPRHCACVARRRPKSGRCLHDRFLPLARGCSCRVMNMAQIGPHLREASRCKWSHSMGGARHERSRHIAFQDGPRTVLQCLHPLGWQGGSEDRDAPHPPRKHLAE